jgi:phospholipase C
MLMRGERSEAGLLDLLPLPGRSGIEHVVVVTMENRSFDHLLGWLPGANGRQAGLSYPDASGVMHPTFALAPTIDAFVPVLPQVNDPWQRLLRSPLLASWHLPL